MFKRSCVAALVLAGASFLNAADWLTFGADPQRSGWAQKETVINSENVKTLGLTWKLQLDVQAKELNALTAPLLVEQVYTDRGVKDLVIVAGASDSLFVVDADSGKLVWKKTFTIEGKSKQEPHWLCPNALNATPVVQKGGVGQGNGGVYTIASDGKLHVLNVINSEDKIPPVQFVPPFSKNWSLNLVNGVLYTAVSQGCNGAKSGIYAMDMVSPEHKISFFQSSPAGAGVWGRAGVALGASGQVFAETGDGPWDPATGRYSDTVLGLSPKDLHMVDYYTPANRDYVTKKDLDMGNMSPIVFPFKEWELVAAAGKEGVIYLLDAKSMGGANHRVPLFRSPRYLNDDADFAGRGFWGSFATYQDGQGQRWLFAPAWGPLAEGSPAFGTTNGPAPNGSIMAFKIEEKEGKPVLTPAWLSRDMNVPEPPVVANGVVFAVSSGENVRQLDSNGKILNSLQRSSKPSGNATLFAFDAATGKELFSSGKTMPSFTHFSGIAVANGRIYVSTHDSVLYAFGLKE